MSGRMIGVAAAIVAMVAIVIVGVLANALMRPPASTATMAYAMLGKAALAFPPSYARIAAETNGGRVDRLDLAAYFPDFKPAGRIAEIKPGQDPTARDDNAVFVTLTPDDGSLDPADRPVRLYARFVDPIGYQHPGGLVRRRFQDGSPYENEELFMALPEGRAFWARCPRPPERGKGLPEPCLWETRMDGLDVSVRFSPTLLTEWERLSDGVRGMVKAFVR